MIDTSIQWLLEQAIDSPVKLQLCLLFHENRRMEGTAAQLADRIYRDIWTTREALREMAEDGILYATTLVGEPVYRYQPRADLADAIFRLEQGYNEPLERDAIQRALREIASYAPYRRATLSGGGFERKTI